MRLKKGDKIVCVMRGIDDLTYGKSYEVVHTREPIISISNEKNTTLTYKLKDIVYKTSPVDLAKIAHYYSPEIVKIIFSCLKDEEDKAKFLSVSSSKTIDYILAFINENQLYSILSLMDADDISDVLEEITDRTLVIKMRKVINFFKDEEGATAVEYAIMVALIAIVIIAMVVIGGKKANNAFSSFASAMPT